MSIPFIYRSPKGAVEFIRIPFLQANNQTKFGWFPSRRNLSAQRQIAALFYQRTSKNFSTRWPGRSVREDVLQAAQRWHRAPRQRRNFKSACVADSASMTVALR